MLKHLENKRDAMKDVMEKRHGLKLAVLPENAKHEVGKTYFSGYWQQTYTVLEYREQPEIWQRWSVKVRWQDGEISNHSTALDPYKDFLVTE
jgi:NDP-sugar pyrophosphorylase family protein